MELVGDKSKRSEEETKVHKNSMLRCIHLLSTQIIQAISTNTNELVNKKEENENNVVYRALEMAASSQFDSISSSAWRALELLASHDVYISLTFVDEFQRTFLHRKGQLLDEKSKKELEEILSAKLANENVKLRCQVLGFLFTAETIYMRVLRTEPAEKWILESTLLEMLTPYVDKNDTRTVEMFVERVRELQSFYRGKFKILIIFFFKYFMFY
jgi:hypothetical protein